MKKILGLVLVGILLLGMVSCTEHNRREQAKIEDQRIEEQERIEQEQQEEEARIQEEKEQEAIEELKEHPVIVVASEPKIGDDKYRIFDNKVHANDSCRDLRSRDIIAGYSDDEKFKDCVLCPICFENAPSKVLGEIYDYEK